MKDNYAGRPKNNEDVLNKTISPQEFKSTQRQSWDITAAGWKKYLKTIEEGAHVVSEKLVELAQIRQGHRVLDIATGAGEPAVTAAKKVGPNGKVTGIDISPRMLAVARERAKENGLESILEFKESDAESFKPSSSAFDAIISRWGLMFMPDLTNYLKTLRGSLVQNGRIAAAVWSNPEKVPLLSIPFSTLMKEAGVPPPSPGTPGPFSLADTKLLRERFDQAGFQEISIEIGNMSSRIPSAEEFTRFHWEVTGPLRLTMEGLSDARQQKILNAITEAGREYADPNTGIVNLNNEVIYVSAIRS